MSLTLDRLPSIEAYVLREGYEEIGGWTDPGAFTAAAFAAQLQAELGLRGAIAEIGVHHGRFFIGLCLLRSPGEHALAIDVFEDQALNVDGSGLGDQQILEGHVDRFLGTREGLSILKEDSLKVTRERILAETDGAPVRLFSVDGSHTAEHTHNDLRLAAEVLSPSGVILLDDFGNPAWPGVMQGAERFLTEHEDFRPLLCGNGKLLIVRAEDHASFSQHFRRLAERFSGAAFEESVLGAPAMRLDLGRLREYLEPEQYQAIFGQELHAAFRFTAAEGHLFELLEGWSSPESWGTWTVGEEATLEIRLEAPGDADLELAFTVHGVDSGGQVPPREVQVMAGGEQLGTWRVDRAVAYVERVVVPSRHLRAGRMELVFRMPGVRSPEELGIGPDTRRLGVGFHSLLIASAP